VNVKSLYQKRNFHQVGSLYASMMLSLILGLGINIINTRLLGPEQYGNLKFIQNLFNFVVPFLSLGFFTSGARLVAQKKNENIKFQIIGSLTIWALVISVIMILGFIAFSFFQNRLFHNNLNMTIRIFSPFLFVFPFMIFLEEAMYGDNRIFSLSFFKLLPLLGYFIIALLYHFYFTFSLKSAMMIQLGIYSVLVIIFVKLLKPRFTNIQSMFNIIKQENRNYGFHVYTGALFGVATAQLAGIAIGFFRGNVNVGFYLLALTSAMPLTMIPQAVAMTFFKDFTNQSAIPFKATIATLFLSTTALIVYLLIIKKLFILLYSDRYLAAIPLSYIIAFGCYIHGFGDYINKFLGAHGKGREMRNGAFLVGLSNILGYTLLVNKFGSTGAAATAVISDSLYCYMMYYYYKKSKFVIC